MGAMIRILIISATIVIPWGVIRMANLETKIVKALQPVMENDALIIGLLVIPPLALLLIHWLFEPRSKRRKRHSGIEGILIKFRG